MYCPFCRNPDSRVVDSRIADDGSAIRRRRQCPECGRRFTTVETTSLTVIKRSGVGEPFSRSKVINGVRKACQGRPVTEDDLAMLAQEVEETIRAAGAAEIDAHEVGLAILNPLQRLDEVAYLRFASVYQAFESLEDFEAAISLLRHEAESKGREGTEPAEEPALGAFRSAGSQTPVVAAEGKPRPPPAPIKERRTTPGRRQRAAQPGVRAHPATWPVCASARSRGPRPTIPASFFSSAGTIGVRSCSRGRYSSARLEMPPPTMNSSGEKRNSTWEK